MRRISIEELLHLINLLKKDISFIGEWRLLFKDITLYSANKILTQIIRFLIIDWSQVNGTNIISGIKKF